MSDLGRKLADKETLRRLNEIAVREQYNSAASDELFEDMLEDSLAVSEHAALHERSAVLATRAGDSQAGLAVPHVRVLWLVSVRGRSEPVGVRIDIPLREWQRLEDAGEDHA